MNQFQHFHLLHIRLYRVKLVFIKNTRNWNTKKRCTMYLWIPTQIYQMFLIWIKMNLLCMQNTCTHIWSGELYWFNNRLKSRCKTKISYNSPFDKKVSKVLFQKGSMVCISLKCLPISRDLIVKCWSNGADWSILLNMTLTSWRFCRLCVIHTGSQRIIQS